MEWKYIEKLEDKNSISKIEKEYKIELPKLLKQLIIQYNGGKPVENVFVTEKNKEKLIQTLISYNKKDKVNIYVYNNFFEYGYIPFAIAEFGDIICINVKNGNVVLYNHELDEFERVCESIDVFFKSLYE